jgi:putative lipoic acid-binding regulatory protein
MKKQTMDKKNPPSNIGEGLTFPCEFVIKVFGATSNEFPSTVLDIIRKHVAELSDSALQNRLSKDGKYSALSITIMAESRDQLDAIYRELTSNPSILMAL